MGSSSRFEALHRLQDEALRIARATSPPPCKGDGLVMVAGGGRHFVNAYVALTILRDDRNFRLPIQIWHLGPHEMSEGMARLLKRFDVELVDVNDVLKAHPMRKIGGWECKPYALLHSPFERVMLLDADNVPLQDPADLLDSIPFRDGGALFWPDISKTTAHDPAWELFRVPFRDEPEFESGQIVVDKRQAWLPLNLATHYCGWSDIYWQYVNGDKQALQMAWRHLEFPYALCPVAVKQLDGTVLAPKGRRRWGVAFTQHDWTGSPLFHHRVGAEWVLFGNNIEVESSVSIEARSEEILDELRLKWDGRVRPERRPFEGGIHFDLSRGGRCLYRRLGLEEREIELLPGGSIGDGRGPNETAWRVETHTGEEVLTISRPDADICSLTRENDEIWRGRWLYFEQNPVEVIPLHPLETQQ